MTHFTQFDIYERNSEIVVQLAKSGEKLQDGFVIARTNLRAVINLIKDRYTGLPKYVELPGNSGKIGTPAAIALVAALEAYERCLNLSEEQSNLRCALLDLYDSVKNADVERQGEALQYARQSLEKFVYTRSDRLKLHFNI